MAKAAKSMKADKTITKVERVKVNKGTSQGRNNIKLSSMNKKAKANFKKYRGQGR